MVKIRFILSLLLVLALLGCATNRYHKPDTPPVLGKDGWPVGNWENEYGNIIRLHADGTGHYTNKETGVVNTHLIWTYKSNKLRIDRWIVYPNEALSTSINDVPLKMIEEMSYTELRKQYPSKNIIDKNISRNIRNYYANIQYHDWWIFNNVLQSAATLNGVLYGDSLNIQWDYNGNITRVEETGLKSSSPTIYILQTSAEYLAKKERERVQEEQRIQSNIEELVSQNNHQRIAIIVLNATNKWSSFAKENLNKMFSGDKIEIVEVQLLDAALDELKINVMDLSVVRDGDKDITDIMNLVSADAIVVLDFADQESVKIRYLTGTRAKKEKKVKKKK